MPETVISVKPYNSLMRYVLPLPSVTFQIKKFGHGKHNERVQGHRAYKRGTQDLTSGS